MPATATSEQIEQTIMDQIAKLGPDRDEIKRDSTFESLEIDSLDLVEVAQVVEDEYGVQIKGEEAEKLNTVGDAVDLVVQRASS